MPNRISFELNDQREAELRELMRETGARDYSSLINAAVSLLRWARTETQRGRAIASIDEATQKYKTLEMNVLVVAPASHGQD